MNTPLERLEIAKLVSYTILDPEKDNPEPGVQYKRMSSRWENVAKRKRTEEKLSMLLSKTRLKLNVYMMLSRKSRDPFYAFTQWRDELSDMGIEKDDSAINLIITDELSNGGNNLPPTPWMTIHMLCQVFYELLDEEEDSLAYQWQNLLEKIYPDGEFEYLDDLDHTAFIMNDVFTFRSARNNVIFEGAEGLIELMVESVVYGKLSRNKFPVINKGWDESPIHPVSEEKVEKIWKSFARKYVQYTYGILSSVQGRYVFT